MEMLKLHIELNAKLKELEGKSRRENIRIYVIKEGSENDVLFMAVFLERLPRQKVEIPEMMEI